MFSEVVDDVIARSGRKDRLADIVDYLNATVKEVQAKAFFFKDGVEDQIDPNTIDPTIWTYPKSWRKLKAVKYPDGSWVNPIQPGRGQSSIDRETVLNFWYAAGNYIVFVGSAATIDPSTFSPTGNKINLFYYTWAPRLRYYPVGFRPATYDEVLQTWTYYDLSSNPDTDNNLNYTLSQNQPIALLRVTNWLLDSWSTVLKEGTLNKLWLITGDQARAVATYSLYNKGVNSILAQEQQEGVDG